VASVPQIRVNGHCHDVPDNHPGTLLGWLRSVLGLTGAKPGCGEGACGACTVLMDSEPVLACQEPLAGAAGATVTTVEGLASGGSLHPVQQALVEERAMQCGYCTPGIALRIAALLDRHPEPDSEQIDSALGPALCRCGCYPSIIRAVGRAALLTRPAGEVRPMAAGDKPAAPLASLRVRRPWDLCGPEEREYFDVLGPGVVFVWPPAEAVPGVRPAGGGAWIHIAGDGAVVGFSGKVNVGQGNTTALRMLVAEELDAELDQVHLIQGDTDICPFDMGTFGSRSLPDSGEALRRVAAGAREFLIGETATLRGEPAAELGTIPGRVISRRDGHRLGYGRLASRINRVVVLTDDPALRRPEQRRVVGRPGHGPHRLETVTGALKFGSDRVVPGVVYAAVLRPPVLGAVLESVDTGAAEALPGVRVIRAGSLVGALADDIIKAREGVGVMRAEWKEPAPLRVDIETHVRSHPIPGEGWERAFDEATGDIEGAFAASRTYINATYTTAFLAHVPLETSSALARWDHGRLTCEVGTQTPFRTRSRVAEACGVDEADVRILVPPTGGAYGGKHGGDIAAEAAILARAAGRPVRVHWSRSEEFTAGYLRPMAVIDVRAAFNHNHGIAAWEHQVINAGPAALAPPYRTTVRRLRSQPAASPVAQGSYRALGANANNFARESVIDEIASTVGADPLEFRLRHLDDDRLADVLRRAADHFGWPKRTPSSQPGPIGRGLAVGLEKGGRVATCAEIAIDDSGHVRPRRIVTAYECGTIVDPDTVKSQIEGATVMALGGALVEAIPIVDGRPAITRLSDYPVPRINDPPRIDVLLLDRPDLPSAGAGETPMIAVAPAIANAAFNATGQRRRHLPLDAASQ
jgi:CO/xanthine dehydrogenase Mo-binding subunit/aerobic-type carbon monoxide dehydrogenase small subunit (CoxS/CutS family)